MEQANTLNGFRQALLEIERRMISCPVDELDDRYPRAYPDGPRTFEGIPYTWVVDTLAEIGRK